jgi:hypothetical protein
MCPNLAVKHRYVFLNWPEMAKNKLKDGGKALPTPSSRKRFYISVSGEPGN